MRIGILTLPLHTNYGGILQAYALQTVLERMGHEVKVINKPMPHASLPVWKWPYSFPKRIIKKYVLREHVGIFQERHFNQYINALRHNTQAFIDKNIHQRILTELDEIKEDEFDAFVVGSDQIWRSIYFHLHWTYLPDAFLDFTNGWNVKRISYAASFGRDDIGEYTNEELVAIKKDIQMFDSISVREESGINICKSLGVNARCVIDPTMLLSPDDYLSLLKTGNKSVKDNILCSYILDSNKDIEELKKKLAERNHLQIIETNSRIEDPNAPLEQRIQQPVENWLSAFAKASLVITDSFHACVFSILFHKQFVVVGNKDRGLARISSLLAMFGLTGRFINNPKDYHELPAIDYHKVDSMLVSKREEAMEYLTKNLQ
jgi:hypothetical protein